VEDGEGDAEREAVAETEVEGVTVGEPEEDRDFVLEGLMVGV
jgi:hypothetical protein